MSDSHSRLGFGDVIRRLLSHGFSASFISRGIALALGLIVNVLLARQLGPAQFGLYSLALTVATMLAVPLHEGAAILLVREVASSAAIGAWGRLRGGLRAANMGVAIIVVTALVLIVPIVWLRNSSEERTLWLWALLVFFPIYCLAGLRGAALLGLRHPALGQFPDQILRPLLLIFGLMLFGGKLALVATDAMQLHACAALVSFFVGAVLLLRLLPQEVAMAEPQYHFRIWLRSLVPFTLMAGIQVLSSSLAILLLGYFAKEADVAIYRVAYLGATLVIISLKAGDQTLAPQIAASHVRGDLVALQGRVTKMTRLMLCVALPVALVLITLGAGLVRLCFGPSYAEAYWPLVILTLGQLIAVGTGSVGSLLIMCGHENAAMQAILVEVLLNLLLGITLIPHLGALGAAVATAFASGVMNLICVWRANRLLQIRSLPW